MAAVVQVTENTDSMDIQANLFYSQTGYDATINFLSVQVIRVLLKHQMS